MKLEEIKELKNKLVEFKNIKNESEQNIEKISLDYKLSIQDFITKEFSLNNYCVTIYSDEIWIDGLTKDGSVYFRQDSINFKGESLSHNSLFKIAEIANLIKKEGWLDK